MTKVQFGVIAGLLAANVIAQLFPVMFPERVQPEWEYMVETPPDESFQKEVDHSGLLGWEMIFARRALGEGREAAYEVIYKRPK